MLIIVPPMCQVIRKEHRGSLPSKITRSIRDVKASTGQEVSWWRTDDDEERSCVAKVLRAVQELREERNGRFGKLQEREALPWTSKTEADLCQEERREEFLEGTNGSRVRRQLSALSKPARSESRWTQNTEYLESSTEIL